MAHNNPYDKNKIIYCEDTGEQVTGDKYLQTEHWKRLRLKVYKYYNGVCQECGDHIPLEVANIHHRVYKRLGKEKMTDLVLYCTHCHACIHKKRKVSRQTNRNLQNLFAKLTPAERREAYKMLSSHFDIDNDSEKDIDEQISDINHQITVLKKERRKLQRAKEKGVNK